MLQNSPQSIRKSLDNLANDILENSGKIVKSTDLGLPSPVQNTPADWRSHMLPLMMGGEVYKLPVWIKDNHGDNADDDNGTISTRFVVDINLSRMGDIQIDGMIRNITRRFDVSLTSERPMSEAMQGHISQLWSKTMLAIDMRGDIEFRICETQ
jgi:hypothetical protein